MSLFLGDGYKSEVAHYYLVKLLWRSIRRDVNYTEVWSSPRREFRQGVIIAEYIND